METGKFHAVVKSNAKGDLKYKPQYEKKGNTLYKVNVKIEPVKINLKKKYKYVIVVVASQNKVIFLESNSVSDLMLYAQNKYRLFFTDSLYKYIIKITDHKKYFAFKENVLIGKDPENKANYYFNQVADCGDRFEIDLESLIEDIL